ncbi:MAG: HD domain-containing protein [Epsilonproteobacteria bacterium]|nr:HD domain-containing protein [Campylobacterota bacterium]
MRLPNILIEIAKELDKNGAKAVVVGGAVRDSLLNLPIKDIDIEVYNSSYEKLAKILSKYGKVNLVGKSFGVIKLSTANLEFDFSLPRLERKVAKGHKGFEVTTNRNLTFKEAAKRRDFTINAIGYDILAQKILDPYNGMRDLDKRVLRVVDESSFKEDPLRVYRGAQFSARFNLKVPSQTLRLFREMVKRGELEELPKERIFEEFKKFLLKASKPSIALEVLRKVGVIKRYFPHLFALIGTIQDPIYHKEGDVWRHTLMVLDEMAKLRVGDEKRDIIGMFAALTHDIGKPSTTIVTDRVRAFGHDIVGEKLAVEFLMSLTSDKKIIEEVSKLVRYHLRVRELFINRAKSGAIRRLATKVDLVQLERLARADYFGRESRDKKSSFEAGDWFLKKAKELNVLNQPPKALILGRDLIELGLSPSPKFGSILKAAYNAQLEGEFGDKKGGIEWIKNRVLKDLF